MAARYHTTKVHNLQIVTVLQSHSTILPQSTVCRLTQSTVDITVSTSPHQPPTTTKPQTHQEPQKKHIDPKAPKAHKATGKIKNRKNKNPLCYISWVRIAQWLERWSCKPMDQAFRKATIRNPQQGLRITLEEVSPSSLHRGSRSTKTQNCSGEIIKPLGFLVTAWMRDCEGLCTKKCSTLHNDIAPKAAGSTCLETMVSEISS